MGPSQHRSGPIYVFQLVYIVYVIKQIVSAHDNNLMWITFLDIKHVYDELLKYDTINTEFFRLEAIWFKLVTIGWMSRAWEA